MYITHLRFCMLNFLILTTIQMQNVRKGLALMVNCLNLSVHFETPSTFHKRKIIKDHQISVRPHSFPTELALLSPAPAFVSDQQQSR